MNNKNIYLKLCCTVLLLITANSWAHDQIPKTPSNSHLISAPALPPGVSELSFTEFFKLPAGPAGLEPTEKILSLNNKRVRILGFMAHEDDPTAGIFLVAPRPANVAEKADGMADDLPAATLSVYMPAEDKDKILTYRPGPWLLTGTLQLGNHEDANGRISYARLIMDKKDMPVPVPQPVIATTKKSRPTATR